MPIVPLYGVTIHKCIAGGNLDEMRKLATQAEQHLSEHGDVRAALEALKVEIARFEHKKH
jgi:hypothetical protein